MKKLLPVLCICMAILLLLCLLPMPYGYYQGVRLAAMLFFAYMAYNGYKKHSIERMIIFIVLAIIFQPFIKVYLGRGLWNIIDVIAAGYLLYVVWRKK